MPSDASGSAETYHHEFTPVLGHDGVTVFVRYGGQAENGALYDGVATYHPGDARYAELLPLAQANPVRQPPPVEEDEMTDEEADEFLREWEEG